MSNFTGFDISVVVIYFLCVILTGFWAMCRTNRNTVKGYFLAGQSMIWLPVGASLFASNIGSEHFIGLAGSGAAKGIGVGAFELNASILLQLLGWVFLPVYINSGANTLPAYMKKRFGGNRIQCYLATVSLLMYIFTKISVNLYSASLFIYEAVQLNMWASCVILLAMTAVITVTGGLAAVLYTDTLQCFLMLIGSIVLAAISLVKIGGIHGLYTKYGDSIATAYINSSTSNVSALIGPAHCYLPNKKAFQMLRSFSDPDMPWFGFLFGQTPASIWYWCTDQMMVQRAMAAQNIVHAKGGTLFAGVVKLLPLFIMVVPGMVSRILFTDEVACATIETCMKACNQPSGCSNLAYPKLVINLLPNGLRGLMLSVMLAALVTDLTSIFNSASTLFTVDIYHLFRKSPKDKELVLVGRFFVVVMILLSVLWLPVIQNMQGGQLFIYIQAISGYLSPPIAAVYLVAIFWSKGNEKGAIVALIYGLLIGLVKMLLDFVWQGQPCEIEETRPWIVVHLHYMYFAMASFLSCILVMLVVSWATTTAAPGRDDEADNVPSNSCTTYWAYRRRVAQARTQMDECTANQVAKDVATMTPLATNNAEHTAAVAMDNKDVHFANGDKLLFRESSVAQKKGDAPAQELTGFVQNKIGFKQRAQRLVRKYWNVFLGNTTSDYVEQTEKSCITTEHSNAAVEQLGDGINNGTSHINQWLHEPMVARYCLNAGMITIVSLVVAMYFVFSLAISDISIGNITVVDLATNTTYTLYNTAP